MTLGTFGLFDAIISNSYPKDLSEIVSLCNTAILCCENLRPHSFCEKVIKSGEVCELEEKINEIAQMMRKMESDWEFEFKAKLDCLEIIYYKKLMHIFNNVFREKEFQLIPKPVNFDLFTRNAIIEHTVNQISAVKKEAEWLKKTNYGIPDLLESLHNGILKRVS